ncbi:MAG TPA: hypothetical protein VE198_05775 [Actinoallomurus sp.]|nr:hypothetical protein [Actinoallomurus sp.]
MRLTWKVVNSRQKTEAVVRLGDAIAVGGVVGVDERRAVSVPEQPAITNAATTKVVVRKEITGGE